MRTRYFLHLRNGDEIIRDQTGVAVSDLAEVHSALRNIVDEMVKDGHLDRAELDRWEMRVADASGMVVSTIRLLDSAPELGLTFSAAP